MPIYQRSYDWQKEHCKQLFDDIITIGRGDSTKVHFIGTITYLSEPTSIPDVTTYQIIDGQQRLTTLMLLLKVLKNTLDVNQELNNAKINDMLFNINREGENKWKIILTEEDNEVFKKLINNIDVEESSQLNSNFKYFKKLISEKNINYDDIWNGLMRLTVVTIRIDNADDAQAIFESMNSTGLDLSITDMIRNYLLMSHDFEIQKEIYYDCWKIMTKNLNNDDDEINDFLRHYLMMQIGQNISEKKTYAEFKKYMVGRDKKSEAKLIREYSKYYSCIINRKHESIVIKNAIENIENQDTKLARPLLLKILADLKLNIIFVSEAEKILSLIDNYLLRCYICDMLKGGNKMFPSLIRKIEFNDYFKSIENELMKKSGRGKFPRDIIFKDKFIDFQLYNGRENICRYVLFRLENHMNSARKESTSIENKNITIEHIMPKTLTNEWKVELGTKWEETYERYLDTIGNLSLTGYNYDMGNESFSKKKLTYIKSNLCITKELVEYNIWNENSMIIRAKKMAEIATKIWLCPEEIVEEYEDENIVREEDYLESKEIADLWHYLKKKILTELDGTKFHMTAVYGAFTLSKGIITNNIGSINATNHKIYLTYNTKIQDRIIQESPFVENISKIGHYAGGELRSTILSEDDADKAVNLLKKVLTDKMKIIQSQLNEMARKAVNTKNARNS